MKKYCNKNIYEVERYNLFPISNYNNTLRFLTVHRRDFINHYNNKLKKVKSRLNLKY
jgi:hypothetical protein